MTISTYFAKVLALQTVTVFFMAIIISVTFGFFKYKDVFLFSASNSLITIQTQRQR